MFRLADIRLPYRDDKLFSILVLLVFIIPLVFTTFTYENFETTKFALWLVLLGWAMGVFFSRKSFFIRVNGKVLIILGLFLVLGLLASWYSVDLLNSLVGFYYRFTSSLLFYFSWVVFIFLLFAVLDKDRLAFLVKVLVFDALLIAVLSFLQSGGVGYYESLEVPGFLRAPSFLGNPNFSSMFLVMALPFAAVLGIKAPKFLNKLYYLVTCCFITISLFILASRGALLALMISLIVGLILLVFGNFPKKVVVKIFVVILVGIFLGLAITKISRPSVFRQGTNVEDANISLRLLVWNTTAQGILKHPFFGVGPGNFHIFFEQERGKDLTGQSGVFDDAHNLFLQMAATSGMPFALTFLSLIVLAVVQAVRKLRLKADWFVLAECLSIIAFAVAASFTPVVIPCFLLLGVVIAGLLLTENQSRLNIFYPLKTLGFITAAAFVYFGLALIIGEHIFAAAYREYFKKDYERSWRLSNLAIKVNPTNQLYYIYRVGNEIELKKDSREIIPQIEGVKQLHPAWTRSYITTANLYNLLYQQTKNKEFIQAAIKNLETALLKDPYFAERYGQLGYYYYKLGDLSKTVHYLEHGLSLKAENFPAWMLLAKAYQLQNNRVKALYALGKAYKLKPDIIQVSYIWNLAKREPDIRKVPIDVLVVEGRLE